MSCTTDGAVSGHAIGRLDGHAIDRFPHRINRNWRSLRTRRCFRNFVYVPHRPQSICDRIECQLRAPRQHPTLATPDRTRTRYNHSRTDVRAYLPGVEVNRDHFGGSSRARLVHCTWNRLTPASIPNADTSGAEFLLAGTAFAPSL